MGTAPTTRQLRLASYNIHSWRGTDGRFAPERILCVIDSLNADMLALQEVVSPKKAGMPCSMADIARAHGYHVTFGQTMLREDSRYGNALLSKKEPVKVNRHDISFPDREPRGALEAFFEHGDLSVKVVSTHLGLRRKERAFQIDALLSLVTADDVDATVLMGDFNDWFGLSKVRKLLHRTFGAHPSPPTFPSFFPLFSLDKIHVLPGHRRTSLTAVKSPETRKASDHIPLVSTLDLGPPRQENM